MTNLKRLYQTGKDGLRTDCLPGSPQACNIPNRSPFLIPVRRRDID